MALPIVILQVYDRNLPNLAIDTFAALAIGLCAALVLDAALRAAQSNVASWLAAKYEHGTGLAAFDHLLGADIAAFEEVSTGVHVDRMQSVDVLREFYSSQAGLILVDLPFIAVFLGLTWFIAGSLVLVPLVLVLLFGLLSLILGARLRGALARRYDTDDRRYDFVVEALRGMHTVKSMAMEAMMVRRYERLQGRSAASVAELSRLGSISQGASFAFSQIAMAAVVAVGSLPVIEGRLTIGALAAATMLTGRALQPVQRTVGLWAQYQGVRLARAKLAAVMAIPGERPAPPAALARPPLAGQIELRDVVFRHPGAAGAVLDGVSLVIEPGETIGITGENGSGKSTLLALIQGLLRPTAGAVLLDGHDMAGLDPAWVRSQIGYMPQNGCLFQGSMLENLTMFEEGERVGQAIELSRSLGLDEVVTRLSRGLDTRLGDAVVEPLPESVRQRIAMVRALAGLPPIVLFDGANAALDQESDLTLRSLLERYRGSRTMVLASLRPSLLSLADRCYRLGGGRLVRIPVPRPAPRVEIVEPARLLAARMLAGGAR
jgi:ATP-binding cassette subfamily C protein LapB